MKILLTFILLVITFSSCEQVQKGQSHEAEYAWKPYSQAALKDAAAHHRPVIIDFYADWCPYCHELAKTLFNRPEIKAKLAQVTALRVNATDQDDADIQKILEQYNIDGLPTIIFLDGQGKEITNARLIGFVTPSDFSQAFALLKIFK